MRPSETLIESEIFGHERGAFTGAIERRAGCFELAEEGTLLLDEIGEMPAATQAKLLRVLEDRRLRRLGSKAETPVDVRVIAATNKDPEKAVAEGELRGDLYYRLNVFSIQMPPLRDHLSDVGSIADRMVAEMNTRHSCAVTGIEPALLDRLKSYRCRAMYASCAIRLNGRRSWRAAACLGWSIFRRTLASLDLRRHRRAGRDRPPWAVW